MKSVTELSLKRPLLILVVFTVLILFGLISYNKLNYDLLPKFDANVITVVTTYVGASSEEVETTLTKKIEEAVSMVEGVDKITASSQQNASAVFLELKNNVNVNDALLETQRKIDKIAAHLPKGADKSVINKFSTSDVPILRIGVLANIDGKDLQDIIEQQVKPQLSSIQGVGEIRIIGGAEREIQVKASADKLKMYGLTIDKLGQIINAASLSTPAGKVETDKLKYTISFDAKFSDIDELSNMVVAHTPSNANVYLKDVATVQEGIKEQTTINHTNGIPAIGLEVLKQTDANSVKLSKLLHEKMASIEAQFKSAGLKFQIASDKSIYTLESANAVMFDLFLAVIIVSLVMLFFLHSIRSSSFVLVALPASMIPTFIMMYIFGFSLNLMTLMALSLVVGILVDDSIVILENIMRHMEMGKKKWRATLEGRSEIGFTAVAITLVDVVVFLPMALAGGLIGNIIREFSLVVVTSTLMSLFVCFTLTPLLASRFGKITHLSEHSLWGKINIRFENMLTNLRNAYTNILAWALRHKRYVFLIVTSLFALTIMLLVKGFVGFSFMSKSDVGELLIKLELEPQATIYQTNMATKKAEAIIMRQNEVTEIFTNIGYAQGGIGFNPSNEAEIHVKLVDKTLRDISSDDFGIRMRDSLSFIPGLKVTTAPVSMAGGSQPELQMSITGPDRAMVKEIANQVKEIVESTPGTQYVAFSTKTPKPEIKIILDREKMAFFNLNPSIVASTVTTAFVGNSNAKYTYNGNEYDIRVQLDNQNASSIDDVKSLSFATAQGAIVSLEQFAKVEEIMGETVLERRDRLPSITVNANIIGRSTGVVGREVTNKIEELNIPEGFKWQLIGMQANQNDSMGSLFLALIIGVLLIYFIMVALYESVIYPFVVLFALPLALIGSVLALALTKNELTIFAMIGFIMLMGLVAKNGILLVDFTNQRKAEGVGLVEALLEAGRERFRPILMTTIAMIVGMLPIALATGSGAEVKNGMAWVIIGGLTSSLLLTLIVVPCVYYIVDRLKSKIFVRKTQKRRKKILRKK